MEANETNQAQAAEQAPATGTTPTTPEETKPTDWKAEARKWESRAKENSAAAAELQKLKESQMTELEKAQARAQAAEAEALALKTQKAMFEHAEEVASTKGVPLEFLRLIDDNDKMDQFADLWAKYKAEPAQAPATIHAAPSASAQRLVSSQTPKTTTRDVFASLFDN